jgi:hypothetical protein
MRPIAKLGTAASAIAAVGVVLLIALPSRTAPANGLGDCGSIVGHGAKTASFAERSVWQQLLMEHRQEADCSEARTVRRVEVVLAGAMVGALVAAQAARARRIRRAARVATVILALPAVGLVTFDGPIVPLSLLTLAALLALAGHRSTPSGR